MLFSTYRRPSLMPRYEKGFNVSFNLGFIVTGIGWLFGIIVILLILSSCQSNNSSTKRPKANNGILDLRNLDITNSDPIRLDGEWDFAWKELVKPDKNNRSNKKWGHIKLPGAWTKHKVNGESLTGQGYATYHLKILLKKQQESFSLKIPEYRSSYAVFIDGILVYKAGKVGETKNTSFPSYDRDIIELKTKGSEIDIMVQVANFHHSSGGAISSMFLGKSAQLEHQLRTNIFLDTLFFTISFTIGIYHLIIFSLIRKQISNLYFGIFSIFMSIRIPFTSEVVFLHLFPGFSWDISLHVLYLTFYFGVPLFSLTIYQFYPNCFSKTIIKIIMFVGGAFSLIVIFMPILFTSQIKNYYNIYAILSLLYSSYVLGLAAFRKKDGIYILIAGFMLGIGLAINDILYFAEFIDSVEVSQYGMVSLVFAQTLLLAKRSANDYFSVEKLSQTFQLFVPQKFLAHIAKEGIGNIRLGNATQSSISLLFADIRSFTNLAEHMNPQEVLNFLNSYFQRMNKVISEHNGYIDKFIGDGLFAIFEGSPEIGCMGSKDAIAAAVALQDEIKQYNIDRLKFNYRPISIGIGINTGPVIIGTVGSDDRMDSTVLGDAVNLTARLESLTKEYDSKIIISSHTRSLVKSLEKNKWRELDKVRVIGKTEPVIIYEIYDSDYKEEKNLKNDVSNDYSNALIEFEKRNWVKALDIFNSCNQIFPTDKVIKLYIDRCQEFITTPPAEDWDGYYSMKTK